MITDPIIEEVYQARQKLLEECEGDLEALLERLKAAEAQDRHRVVTRTDIKPPQQRTQSAR